MDAVSSEQYWNDHWEKTVFEIAANDHPIRRWIEKEIPDTTTGSCMEVGCYPGKFISVFGEKGYTLNGIDLFVGVDFLSEWLKNQGYKTNDFFQADFLNFQSTRNYDVVCSFGFIEHFKNWSEVLDMHLALVKPGGRLIIDVPNLDSPMYRYLYRFLEPEVLKNHTQSAMNLNLIRTTLQEKGCKIKYAGYVGDFYFRFVTKHDRAHEYISNVINMLKPVFRLLPESAYKRYIGVIAIKNN